MSEKLFYGPTRARSKDELIEDMKVELNRYVPGVDWNFSQYIRDNVTECLSGVKGDNSLKIFGPNPWTNWRSWRSRPSRPWRRCRASRTSASSTSRGSRTWSFGPIPSSAISYGVSTADVQGA